MSKRIRKGMMDEILTLLYKEEDRWLPYNPDTMHPMKKKAIAKMVKEGWITDTIDHEAGIGPNGEVDHILVLEDPGAIFIRGGGYKYRSERFWKRAKVWPAWLALPISIAALVVSLTSNPSEAESVSEDGTKSVTTEKKSSQPVTPPISADTLAGDTLNPHIAPSTPK